MKTKLSIFFMAFGLSLLMTAGFIISHNIRESDTARAAAADTVSLLEATGPDEWLKELQNDENFIPDYKLNPHMDMPVVEIEGWGYVGTLEVPVLELELPVMAQWSYPGLKISPCRYSGSPYLNSLTIAAHNYESHFGKIKNLIAGDAVIFTDNDGNRFEYQVDAVEQYEAEDSQKVVENQHDLVLFTCTLGGQYRVVVQCNLNKEASQ
ncbi:MAG: sortase [Hungatella sp.]|jgi:sortase A|nr:sortase [Hungatella sp.]